MRLIEQMILRASKEHIHVQRGYIMHVHSVEHQVTYLQYP